MSNAVKFQLWRIISTLGKSEKRNFKLYATRAGATADNKFIQLFDLIDRQDYPDDQSIIDRLELSPGQYSNLKRHLYQQVLTSLRLIYISKEIDIDLREQIDFAHILYTRGLYLDALRVLERAKGRAVDHNRDLLHLEILEFQKLIESRHITLSRQVRNKMDFLVNESAQRGFSVLNTSELSNMNIQIHGRYIETGHSRTAEDHRATEEFWIGIQPLVIDRESISDSFHQQIHRFQATMWYHYVQLSFEDALESALNARNLFSLHLHMTVKDPVLHLRCTYYAGVFAYLCDDRKLMSTYATEIERFLERNKEQLNENCRRIGHVYSKLMELNHYFSNGNWKAARALAGSLCARYAKQKFIANDHRWGQFLYKFAAAHFMLAEYEKALDHLNDIVNMKLGILREDLLLNTRLLSILCHFELGNNSLVDYHLTNLTRQLRKDKGREHAVVHDLAIAALRKLVKALPGEREDIYQNLQNDLTAARADPFERKALLYLDLGLWMGSRVAGSE